MMPNKVAHFFMAHGVEKSQPFSWPNGLKDSEPDFSALSVVCAYTILCWRRCKTLHNPIQSLCMWQ